MSDIDQGGFVYPFGEVNHSGPDKYPVHEGITLRQHYAGLAVQGLLSSRACEGQPYAEIAERAFVVADAMIEAGKQ